MPLITGIQKFLIITDISLYPTFFQMFQGDFHINLVQTQQKGQMNVEMGLSAIIRDEFGVKERAPVCFLTQYQLLMIFCCFITIINVMGW